MTVLVFCFLLLVLLFIGMPIGFVLLTIGSLGLLTVASLDVLVSFISNTAYRTVNSFTYTTIPLFILMAQFISKSNIADDLFDCLKKWIGHLPGGIGIATIFSSAGFGALSGSSLAATTIMSKICIPQLLKVKYSEKFSAGLVATTTGTLAALIPPSILLVIYAIQTDTSVGKLLIAGLLPGILLAILNSIYVVIIALKDKNVVNKATWKERFISLKYVWPMLLLVLIVLIIIYMGIGTSTEAAAFGAFGALVIGFIIKRLNYQSLIESVIETIKQTAMIFFIMLGAHIFSYFITLTRVGNQIVSMIEKSGLSSWSILLLIILLYLILGLFLDGLSSMLLTLPLVLPVVIGLGYDPIWFGVLVVLLLEIGLVTPPVGINLFITSKNSGIPVEKVMFGSIPFLIILLVTILIIMIFPSIVLYLPSSM
ncbi:hypothetical protein BTR23_22640 [Alkalihalophilus pseudofirmus]|nr:hypothetical protein BTR23_22640 [Alkalihalophilus pseudofirmus]